MTCIDSAINEAITTYGCLPGQVGCYCAQAGLVQLIMTCSNLQCETAADQSTTKSFVTGYCSRTNMTA